MSQLLLDISPRREPAFDNFVIGRNLELCSVLRHALTGGGSERCFYLWGEAGSGKSHLLRASVSAAALAQKSAIYAAANVPECSDVVAVDDVESLDGTKQIALFDLYNRTRDSNGMLLVSGTQSPLHLNLRADLRTRLGWGLVYQVHGLSDEEKAQALAQHAQTKGFSLPPEVTQYLLRHGRRDLPSLMMVLDELDLLSLRLHRAPSVPLLKQIMQTELELK
jgi:DnaA family protein